MHDDRTPHSPFTWLVRSLRSRAEPAGRLVSLLARAGGPLPIYSFVGARIRVAASSTVVEAHVERGHNSRILELAGNIPRSAASTIPTPPRTAIPACGRPLPSTSRWTATRSRLLPSGEGLRAGPGLLQSWRATWSGRRPTSCAACARRCGGMLKETAPASGNGPTSPCSNPCATTRRATLRPC